MLLTSAVSSDSFIRTLDIPSSLQFVHTALKLRLAELSLAFNILLGVVILFAIMIPKYLNSLTVPISFPYIFIFAKQLTNIALVFPMFITKLLVLQKPTS
jgi:predicted anti-sigma-YlaC factor YlaD